MNYAVSIFPVQAPLPVTQGAQSLAFFAFMRAFASVSRIGGESFFSLLYLHLILPSDLGCYPWRRYPSKRAIAPSSRGARGSIPRGCSYCVPGHPPDTRSTTTTQTQRGKCFRRKFASCLESRSGRVWGWHADILVHERSTSPYCH